jgi:hypothetical protein
MRLRRDLNQRLLCFVMMWAVWLVLCFYNLSKADSTLIADNDIYFTRIVFTSSLSFEAVNELASKYHIQIAQLENIHTFDTTSIYEFYVVDPNMSMSEIQSDYKQKRLDFCKAVIQQIDIVKSGQIGDLDEMFISMEEYVRDGGSDQIKVRGVIFTGQADRLSEFVNHEMQLLSEAESRPLPKKIEERNKQLASDGSDDYIDLLQNMAQSSSTWYPNSGISVFQENASGDRYTLQYMKWNDILFKSNQTYEHEVFLYNYSGSTYLKEDSTAWPDCFPVNTYASTTWPSSAKPYLDTRLSEKLTECYDEELEFTLGAAKADQLEKGKTYLTYISTSKGKINDGKFKLNAQLGHRKPSSCYTTWCSYGDEHTRLIEAWNENVPGSVQWGEEQFINPQIGQDPTSGKEGTKFVEWGKGFSAKSTAILHFRKPDGTEYPTTEQKTDNGGNFKINYIVPKNKPPGTYTWWAIDGPTAIKSNDISYEITNNSTTGSVSGKLHADSASGPALSGATVKCAAKSAVTGSSGYFSLSGITPGNRTITFSKSGYITYERSVSVTAGQNADVGDRWLVNNSEPPPSSGPDLAVHELKVKKSSEDDSELGHTVHLQPGEKFDIKVWIKNRGKTKATKQFTVKYLLSDDSEITSGDAVVGVDQDKTDIGAGKTLSERKQKIAAPSSSGTYWVGAWVDSPEDNNKANDFSRGDGERGKIIVESIPPPPPSGSPDGALESATCAGIVGWSRDPDTTVPIKVQFYADGAAGSGKFLGEATANINRPDLTFSDKDHGFNFAIPADVQDGQVHAIYAYGIDSQGGSDSLLDGSPKSITCGTPLPPKVIRVTDPSPGEEWDTDSDHTVNWETENISKSDHLWIGYSVDDGASWHTLDDSAVNDGSKNWDMEHDYNLCDDTDKARIKIYLISDPQVSVVSERFKIDHKKGHPDC